MDVKKGGRYLIKERDYIKGTLYEVTVLEVSPSGARARVKYHGTPLSTWIELHKYVVVETLHSPNESVLEMLHKLIRATNPKTT